MGHCKALHSTLAGFSPTRRYEASLENLVRVRCSDLLCRQIKKSFMISTPGPSAGVLWLVRDFSSCDRSCRRPSCICSGRTGRAGRRHGGHGRWGFGAGLLRGTPGLREVLVNEAVAVVANAAVTGRDAVPGCLGNGRRGWALVFGVLRRVQDVSDIWHRPWTQVRPRWLLAVCCSGNCWCGSSCGSCHRRYGCCCGGGCNCRSWCFRWGVGRPVAGRNRGLAVARVLISMF